MGRLQRKKKPGTKKKRPARGTPPASQARQANAIPAKETRRQPASAVAKGPTRHPSPSGGTRNNYISKAMQFLREVTVELKKVTWPSRKQTTGSTVVMLILVAIISLFLGVVDIGLSRLIQVVLQ